MLLSFWGARREVCLSKTSKKRNQLRQNKPASALFFILSEQNNLSQLSISQMIHFRICLISPEGGDAVEYCFVTGTFCLAVWYLTQPSVHRFSPRVPAAPVRPFSGGPCTLFWPFIHLYPFYPTQHPAAPTPNPTKL